VNNLNIIINAAHFAAVRHANQFRKGTARTPYINHPLEVSRLINTVGMVDDVDILAAAILHDTVEDTGVTALELTDNFGWAVCAYVLEVSDDKSLPKARRKELQIEHAPHLSQGAKVIKMADKICNVGDVVKDPGVDWDLNRRIEYVDWAVKVATGLRGANTNLDLLFDEVSKSARKELAKQI
jgi:guanosine-3',5'-bis(diphosphate) 3'-pyrophosphohydrolase